MKKTLQFLLLILLTAQTASAATVTVIVHNTSPGVIRDGSIQRDGNNFTGAGIPYPLTGQGDYVGSFTSSQSGTFRLRYSDLNFVWWLSDEQYNWDGNSNTTMEFWAHGTNPGQPQTWKIDAQTCNDTLFDQEYDVLVGGLKVGSSGVVKPGDCFNFHYEDTIKKSIQMVRYQRGPDGERTNPVYSRVIGTNDSHWYQSGNSPGANSATDSATGVPMANTGEGKIPYANTNNAPATDDTLRKVGDALYDAIAQAGRESATEGRAQTAKLDSIQNAINSGFLVVNGKLVEVNSALATLSGQVGTVNTALAGINTSLGTVNTGIGNLGTKLDTANSGLAGLSNSLGTANSTLTSLKTTGENAYAKLVGIDNSLGTVNSKLDTVHSDGQIVIAKIGDLNETAEGLAKESTLSLFKSEQHTDTTDLSAKLVQVKDSINTADINSGSRDQARLNKLIDIEADARAIDSSVQSSKTALVNSLGDLKGEVTSAHTDARTDATAILAALNAVYTAIGGANASNHYDNLWLGGVIASNKLDLDPVVKALDTNTAVLQAMHKTLTNSTGTSIPNQSGSGGSAGNTVSGQIDQLSQGLSVPSDHTFTSGSWVVSLGAWSVDLNPLHMPEISNLAGWLRNVVTWVVTVLYVLACIAVVDRAMQSSVSARQASSAATLPGASTGLALAAAGAMTVALATIPALIIALTGIGGFFGHLSSTPLAGGGSVVQMGVGLANAFLPLDLIVTDVILYIIFRLKVMSVFWLSSTVVRFLVA